MVRLWRPRFLSRTPSILQMEAAECAGACIAMVLARHGRWEALDSLREACAVSRNGVSAASLLTAAGQFGLQGEAYRVEVDALATLPMPQILFWAFNHYVVLDRAEAGGFSIIDPAFGRRHVTPLEMGRSFTGVTLVFARGAAFQAKGRPSRLLTSLWDALSGSRPAAASLVGTVILLTLTGILLPSLTRIFVDDYLGQGRRDWLVALLLGCGLLVALRTGLTWMQAQLSMFLQNKVGAIISARIVWTLLRLPFGFFSRRSAAEISTRMQLAQQIAGTASGPLLNIANTTVMVVGYGLAMAAYSLILTVTVLLVMAANLALLWAVKGVLAEIATDAQMMASRAHGNTVQGIALLEESRATGMVPLLFRHLLDVFVEETNAEQRALAVTQRAAAIPFFCNQLLAIVVLGLGAYEVMRSELTIGGLLAFQMLSQLFAAPLQSVIGLGTALTSASGSLARTQDLLEGRPRDGGAQDGLPFAGLRLDGRVALTSMAFGYDASRPLFTNLSAVFEPGTMTLILGDTGSGKTTLAMLLAGILAPTSGRILWDGMGADAIPAEAFRHSLGLAEQTPFFAAGSLRDTLSLWDVGQPTAALRTALRCAAMDAVIMARPGGLGGRIGEGGAGFSGGELQRLGLARALLMSPSVLIIDDATTALDPATEEAVLGNLRERGLTVIMLTSRESLRRHFLRVLRIEDGRLSAVERRDRVMAI